MSSVLIENQILRSKSLSTSDSHSASAEVENRGNMSGSTSRTTVYTCQATTRLMRIVALRTPLTFQTRSIQESLRSTSPISASSRVSTTNSGRT